VDHASPIHRSTDPPAHQSASQPIRAGRQKSVDVNSDIHPTLFGAPVTAANRARGHLSAPERTDSQT